MDLLLISVFVSVVGAVLSLLLSKKEDTAKKVACFFGTIASAIAVIAGVGAVLLQPQEHLGHLGHVQAHVH